MKNLILLYIGLFFSITACEKDINPIGENPPTLLSPADADSFNDILIMPDGALNFDGQVYSTHNGDEPTVNAIDYIVSGTSGATTIIKLSYANAIPRLGGCFVQVEGASSYYKIPFPGNPTTSGTWSLPIGIPESITPVKFCMSFYVYDSSDKVSEATTACINMVPE